MRRVAFFRHGHSPNAVAAGVDSDFDRPLSEHGRQAVRDSAQKLKNCGVKFGLIIASPLVRAAQTAELLSEVLDIPSATLQALDGASGPARVWRELLPEISVREAVLVVGHQPGMGMLAGALLRRPPFGMEPADFVLLKLDKDFDPASGLPGAAELELSSCE